MCSTTDSKLLRNKMMSYTDMHNFDFGFNTFTGESCTDVLNVKDWDEKHKYSYLQIKEDLMGDSYQNVSVGEVVPSAFSINNPMFYKIKLSVCGLPKGAKVSVIRVLLDGSISLCVDSRGKVLKYLTSDVEYEIPNAGNKFAIWYPRVRDEDKSWGASAGGKVIVKSFKIVAVVREEGWFDSVISFPQKFMLVSRKYEDEKGYKRFQTWLVGRAGQLCLGLSPAHDHQLNK